jgi:membrane associated rhomboid family serine protease
VLAIGENGWKLAPASENPTIGPSPKVLMDLGAKRADCILDEGQWWRFIAPMLLHAGVLHIVGNMVVLMRLGYSMEQAFGTFRVATIYLVSGFGGNLASAIFLPQVVVVGASGALFGLIGALFGDFIQNFRVIREGRWCYLLQLVVVSGVGLAMGIFPLIDNFSHIGGWLCGILAGTAFLAGAQRDPATGKRVINCWTVPLAFLCVVLLTGLLIAGVSVFYSRNDSDSFCSWCKNLSCVETQYWNCCSVRPDEDCTAQANNTVLYHC